MTTENGAMPPAYAREDDSSITDGAYGLRLDDDDNDEPTHTGCLPDLPFSTLDSEYDETLAFPDSVTILSNVGDKPVLVERNETDDDELPNQIAEIPFATIYGPGVKFNSFQRKVFIPGMEIKVRIIDNDRSVTTHLLNPNLYTLELEHGPFTWTIKKRYKHFNSLHQQLSFFRTSLNIPFPMRSHKERRLKMENVAIEMAADEYRVTESLANTNTTSSSVDNTDKAVERKHCNSMPSNFNSSNKKKLFNNNSQRSSNKPLPMTNTVRKKKKRKLPRFPNRPESLITVESLPARIKQLENYLYNLLNISLYRSHHETFSIYA